MELHEVKENLQSIKDELTLIRNKLNINELQMQMASFEEEFSKPDFWNDTNAQRSIKANNLKKKVVNEFKEISNDINSLYDMSELLESEFETSLFEDMLKEFDKLNSKYEIFKIKTTFTNEHDKKNAIMTIKPGAGGTEACDWAMMLVRMYIRWAERNGYDMETLEFTPGDEAGIKIASILLSFDYAYGFLKGEIGIHRLVRLSPFNAAGKRHTSFASVYIIPEIDEDVKFDVEEKDLRIDTYHASGPGGQSVNTANSAVRITHIPTGIFAACQVERSQRQNKEKAMRLLYSRLYEHFESIAKKEIESSKAEKKDIAWGHQIRSYVFQPYTMVKDLRTGVETGNIEAVMNGEIDDFIKGYLSFSG